MRCPDELMLEEYVDDYLAAEDRARVESHLQRCDPCAATLSELRDLARAVAVLPRSIEPPRDLAAGILRRASAGSTHGLRPGRMLIGLAAALLLVFAGAIAVRLMRGSAEIATVPPTAAVPVATSGLEPLLVAELRYIEATHDLLAVLERSGKGITPQVRRIVEQNLEVIDDAIASVRRSLDDEPSSAHRARTLNALYEQKYRLLFRISQLVS